MKISKEQLKKVIKEELEGPGDYETSEVNNYQYAIMNLCDEISEMIETYDDLKNLKIIYRKLDAIVNS